MSAIYSDRNYLDYRFRIRQTARDRQLGRPLEFPEFPEFLNVLENIGKNPETSGESPRISVKGTSQDSGISWGLSEESFYGEQEDYNPYDNEDDLTG
jgi:hypothetical protein